MEHSITGKMEVMGERMDELDDAIAALMAQADLDPPTSPAGADPTSTGIERKSSGDPPIIPASARRLDQSTDSRTVL